MWRPPKCVPNRHCVLRSRYAPGTLWTLADLRDDGLVQVDRLGSSVQSDGDWNGVEKVRHDRGGVVPADTPGILNGYEEVVTREDVGSMKLPSRSVWSRRKRSGLASSPAGTRITMLGTDGLPLGGERNLRLRWVRRPR